MPHRAATVTASLAATLLAACGPRAHGHAHAAAGAPRSVSTLVTDTAAAPGAPADTAGEHVVFAVEWMDGGTVEAEAIAVRSASGTLDAPPDDSADARAFAETYLDAGHSYPVLVAGRRAGTVSVRRESGGECAANGVLVDPHLSGAYRPRVALASDIPVRGGAPLRRDASPAERAAMVVLLRDSVVKRGGPGAWRNDAEVRVAVIALRGGTTALAGSAIVRTNRDDVAAPVTSIFAITDPANRRVLVWYHPATDPAADYPMARTLLDVADLDGDGAPEVVARTDLSEAWEYTVYRHTPAGWTQAFETTGGGC